MDEQRQTPTSSADPITDKRARIPLSSPPSDGLESGDLHATLPLTQQEARAGTSRAIRLPGGRQTCVVVPAGASEGQVLSLEGLGEPAFAGGPRGKLTLTLTITPAPETAEESLLKRTALISSPSPSPRQAAAVLLDLIAHRLEDPATNPLAASVGIADPQARRFYAAINGRRTVRELCTLTALEEPEVAGVVQRLLAHHRIQLAEPGGQLVESSLLFGDP